MGIVQKIFYVHVPSAMSMYAGFIVTSVASVFYLLRPRRGWDIAAMTGVEVGLLLGVFVLVSGPLWGLKAWGKAWTWDPQLTATAVLFLMYGGYWLLRLFSGPSQRVRTIAAVLAILAAITIPFVHFAVRIWGGIHPTVEREGGEGLAPAIGQTFGVSMLAILLLVTCLIWMQIRVRMRQAKLDELYIEVEDIMRSRAA
jgi:heme exporter protein C